jgi:hypothetical protein
MYPSKNASDTKSFLARMGINSESYTPAAQRTGSVGNGYFYNTFQSNFSETSAYDRILTWNAHCRGDGGHDWDGDVESTPVSGRTLSDLNSTYSKANNVLTYYELGQNNTATGAPGNTLDTTFTNVFNNNTNVQVSQDGLLAFYPYIKMRYTDKNNSSKDVYITSTNKSQMPAYTKIEAGVWKGGAADSDSANGNNPTPNVQLESSQWSTHQSSLTFMDHYNIDDTKSVLPGGAGFDVSMKKPTGTTWTGESSDQPTTSTKLGYRIYQTCIDDSLAGTLDSSSTAPTLSEAKAQVAEFDQSVKDSVANYGLVQAVCIGRINYKGYLKEFISSGYAPVYNGGTWMGLTLNEDNKYYLKMVEPGESSSSSGLDTSVTNFGIHAGGIRKQNVYTIQSDTDGNITVKRDGTQLAKISATQGIENLLSNAEIKRVDDATKAVTNFVSSIDRNLSSNNSLTRQNKTWYNEAFDGITVLYSYLSYDIGLGDGSTGILSGNAKSIAKRTAQLDVFLSGKQDNKADMYNFKTDQDEKLRSSMILTGEYKNGVPSRASTGKIGCLTLKNGNKMQTELSTMETFAYTKMFYIPNVNVTDLN